MNIEDFIGSNIGDIDLKTLQREFYTQPVANNSKTETSEDGDHKKNSITIIHHWKPEANSKDAEKLSIEGEIPIKEDCVQRRSTELITAVQSYTDPPAEEEEDAQVFGLSEAAMTAQLMDMFENEILYSCSELDNLLSDDEELRMAGQPSTSLGRS